MEELKALLGIPEEDTTKDKLVEFIKRRVEKRVCSYCNLHSIPDGLRDTVSAMIVDTYRSAQYGQEKMVGELKGMERGDTSWTYQTASQIAIEKIKNPSFTEDYASDLKRYRKVRWPK